VKHLSLIGGLTLADIVRKILEKIIGTQLARQFNYTGVNGKLKFQGSILMSVLIGKLN